MCQTKDILERLSLPPAKDLETLLQDAAKPSASSRNASDSRSGKQISRRVSLPPFPWSHAYNGHCRTNTDSVKLLANRSTCSGRWMTIKHKLGSPLTSTNCFTDLESVVYDQTLVPSPPDLGIRNQALVSSEGPPLFERDSSPGTSCPRAVGDLFGKNIVMLLFSNCAASLSPSLLLYVRLIMNVFSFHWKCRKRSSIKGSIGWYAMLVFSDALEL